MSGGRRGPRRAKGFSLIEVVVVIAVISILASMAVPYAAQIINQSREESTRREMEELHRTVAGDPASAAAGFVGDMGRLPAGPLFLRQLNEQGGQPGGGAGLLGVRFGWNGPYVNTGFDPAGYRTDGWGTAYAYGNPGAGQIRSAGRDRALGTADDLVHPPAAVNINGQLLVNLHVWRTDNTTSQYVLNPQPAAFPGMTATVRLYYSNGGIQANTPASTPGLVPPYLFTNFHSGFHAVTAVCTLPPNPQVSGQAVVYIPGNNQQAQLNLYLR